jgi:hypothetical protein
MVASYRAYYKGPVAGVGVVYELSTSIQLSGMFNCRVLSFGFQRNALYHQLAFTPIDSSRPIVLALSCNDDKAGFICFDEHRQETPKLGMRDYESVQSEHYIECGKAKKLTSHSLGEAFWSVRVQGELFVQVKEGKTSQFDTQSHWSVDLDSLCAFMAGAIDVRSLRIGACRMKRIGSEIEKLQRDLKVSNEALRCLQVKYDNLKKGAWALLRSITEVKFRKTATAARRFQKDLLAATIITLEE